jgi:hypothetical protein
MDFLKKNWMAIVIIFLLLFNEIGHLAFKYIPFNEKVGLNAPVYYFSLAVRNLMTSIIILLLIPGKASKALISGAIGWNTVELYQEFCYLAKIDEKVLYFNDGLIGQIAFICCIIILVYLSSVKSKS